MDKPLFYITCTTCQARLAVRDEAAIGTILLCPKCQSFVQVLAPAGWHGSGQAADAPEAPAGPATPDAQHGALARPDRPSAGGAHGESPKPEPGEAHGAAALPTGASTATASAVKTDRASPKPPPDPALPDTVEDFPELQRPVSERSERAKAVARAVPPPLPPGRSTARAPGAAPVAASLAASAKAEGPASPAAPPTAPPPPPVPDTFPATALWPKWVALVVAPVAGLAVAAGLLSIFLRDGGQGETPEESAISPSDQAPPEDPPEKPAEPLLPVRIDARWVPDDARLMFVLRLSRLQTQPEFGRAADSAPPECRKAVQGLLDHLGLHAEGVHRLYWSAADLIAWAEHAVVVLELEEDQDAAKIADRGRDAGFRLGGAACRQEPGQPWPHPFAAVHRRLLVTGEADLLRGLAEREKPQLRSKPLERMLQGVPPEADAALMVDLGAARAAGWRLPVALLDVWPAGRQPWHVLWEVPQGLAVSLRLDDQVRSETALICEAETATDKVRAAVEELMPAAQTALSVQAASLAERVRAGQIKADAANQYEDLLKQAQGGLKAARVEVAESALWVRIQWPRSFADLARAGLASRAAVRADWLAAALGVDEENQRRVLAGLSAHAKAEGSFPAGAAGGSLWPPETRLSWIAAMLPYLGHRDWHGQLQFGYSWNSPQNKKVTQRPLEEVINPALGPGATEAGFPVTHYVGLAGVGEDAGKLPADDPRAGVFGFGRATRPEDIADGASNTIAIVGAGARLGAWGSGGDPTVRAFTKRPYVNGPDGFGSGQPDGMLVGMADGAVRFVSKDVDPRVLELLATARGGQPGDLASLDPRPKVAVPKPAPAVAEAPKPKPDPPAKPLPAARPPAAAGELVKVDVRARLDDKIAAIELPDVPLARVIELIESFSTLRITFDLEEMDQLGVAPQDPIKLKLADSTVGHALEAALAQRGLVHVVEGNYVLVTRPAKLRESLHTVRYSVSDLAGGEGQDAESLGQLVERLVAPETWQASGGKGKIDAQDDVLVVEQTDLVHHQVIEFCEKLRVARGLPTRSSMDPRHFKLDTRLDRAKAALHRPVTANYVAPTPLAEIVAYLEEAGETTIVVDWITLGAEGVPPGVQGTLKSEKQPLAAALTGLLEPLGLAFRVAAGDTLQVTTRQGAQARLDLEFYPAAAVLAADGKPEALIEQIKTQVAGGTWNDAAGPGVIHCDAPSKCLLVLQSQPVQAEVQGLLERMKAEKAGEKK